LICTWSMFTVLKWPTPRAVQNWLLYRAYVPSTAPTWQRTVSDLLMGGILLPGACIGAVGAIICQVTGTRYPPLVQRFMSVFENLSKDETGKPQSNATPSD
jgi:hypothetical protein